MQARPAQQQAPSTLPTIRVESQQSGEGKRKDRNTSLSVVLGRF